MKSVRDKKADRQIDRMLSQALTQKAKPDAALQQRICSQWKEKREMNQNRKWIVAAAASVCVLAVTVSVGAAGRYLSSRQVAEEFNMDNMAKAFSKMTLLLTRDKAATLVQSSEDMPTVSQMPKLLSMG